MKTKQSATRRALALFMSMLMLLTAWVFVAPTASAEGEAAYLLELPEAGGTLEDGKVYAVNEDKTINGGANQNGLVVANGATVVIYIASSATLTVTGGAGSNASGTTAATGGKAAIYVPADATLILTGAGTLKR